MRVVTHKGGGETIESIRFMKTRDLDIFVRNSAALSILNKVVPEGTTETMAKYISSRKPFGIESNIVKSADWHTSKTGLENPVKCYGKRMQLGYVERDLIRSNSDKINEWKIYTPRANNIGTELNDDNLNTYLGEPGTICTEAYIAIGFDLNLTKSKAENLMKYFNTKFVRYMHAIAKASHDAPKTTYRFVPVVDFNEEWTDEKLYTHFKLTEEEINLIETSIKPMA